MASALRFLARRNYINLLQTLNNRQFKYPPVCYLQKCLESTKETKQSLIITDAERNPLKEDERDWISYGYHLTDRDTDNSLHHLHMLFLLSIGLIGTIFLYAYMPDYKLTNWSRAEAYLELHRREKEGEPLIDPNLVNPGKIDLPSDKDLGDFEVII